MPAPTPPTWALPYSQVLRHTVGCVFSFVQTAVKGGWQAWKEDERLCGREG